MRLNQNNDNNNSKINGKAQPEKKKEVSLFFFFLRQDREVKNQTRKPEKCKENSKNKVISLLFTFSTYYVLRMASVMMRHA